MKADRQIGIAISPTFLLLLKKADVSVTPVVHRNMLLFPYKASPSGTRSPRESERLATAGHSNKKQLESQALRAQSFVRPMNQLH